MTEITKVCAPVDGERLRELMDMLSAVFGESEAKAELPTMTGEENAFNRDTQYFAHEDGVLLGAAHITSPLGRPDICCASGVCTSPQARGRGIGRKLMARCMADFDEQGGAAAFLGTENPVAARLYASVGFGFLPGSNVMARTRDGYLAFEKGYFAQDTAPLKTIEGGPALRVPLVPLALHRCGALLMDCNAGIMGSDYATQRSCAGLYPKYQRVQQAGGAFFGALAQSGALCAVSSVMPTPDGMRMDFFAHECARSALPGLIGECERRGAEYALVSPVDTYKREALERLGYAQAGHAAYSAGPLMVDCAVMRKKA